MKANLRRGFNRLFVVLTAVWFVYCLLVYPMQQRATTDAIYQDELRRCYEHELGKSQEFKDCLNYARVKSGVDEWSLKAFYKRESWFLALIVVIVPLLTYGLCRAVASLSLWVWRGFS